MRSLFLCCCALFGLWGGLAYGLTPEEVIKLKQAGISDETIQKMLEQERAQEQEPGRAVEQQDDKVIYRAGQNTRQEVERHDEHERWKEERSMDMLDNMVIDGRRQK